MVSINRVTKVVKGGKNLSFSALVVVGDPAAKVVGLRHRQSQGSALGDPQGDRGREEESAQDQYPRIRRSRTRSLGRFGSGLVLLKPAPEGTGVIAGGPVRAVIQAAAFRTC